MGIEVVGIHLPESKQPCQTIQWANIGNDVICGPQVTDLQGDASIQIEGTFAGGTVQIQGSNDGNNWHILLDHLGDPLVFTASDLRMYLLRTRLVRGLTSAGTGMDITMTLYKSG